MAKRNVQFFRNKSVMGSYDTHQTAITNAEGKFRIIAQDPGLLDGEIVLYRYTINNSEPIHTIVGVVCEKDGVKHIEILGNYDILKGEITKALTDAKAYTDTQLQDLSTTVSNENEENQPVVVKITQVDGKLTSVEVTTNIDVTGQIEAALENLDGSATIASVTDGIVALKAGIVEEDGIIYNTEDADIKLAKVATTGKAEDVTITDSSNVITATTVEGALVEIATEIDNMKLDATDVVTLNATNTALQASKIREANGKVEVAQAQSIVEFNQAISSTNKVATMSDVTTAVNNAAYTEGTNVKIDNDRKINVPLGLIYDKDAQKIYLVNDKSATSATTENIIDDINTTDFVVDGMLSNAELKYGTLNGETFTPSDNGEPYLVLTFNADGTTQGAKTIYVPVKDLVDVYTGDETYITVENYTVKHKEQTNLNTNTAFVTTITGEIVGANDSQNRKEGQTIQSSELTFTVPSLKVDKAGHIVELKTEEIKFILPPHSTASQITITDTADNFTATNVEDALAELASDITTVVEGIKNYATIKVGENSIAPSTSADELTVAGDAIISIKAETDANADKLTFSHKTADVETVTLTDKTLTLRTDQSISVEVPILTFDDYGHLTTQGTQKYNISKDIYRVTSGNGITITPELEGINQTDTISVKLNPNTNDMLSVDANGLNLNSSWDCGEYV